ncbi:MAG: hypothetical protein QGI60_01545 [archaeon]|nr:hypothetical protein [archaeon]
MEANVLWIFIFTTVMVFFQARKKNRLYALVILILMLYAIVEFVHFIGWHIPEMLQLPLFIANVAIVTFEDNKTVNKHKGVLGPAVFWVLLVIFQFFL